MNYGMILWLSLLCLVNKILADVSLSSLSKVHLSKTFTASDREASASVVGGRTAYLLGEGLGFVDVSILSLSKKTEQNITCRFQSRKEICVLWSQDDRLFDSQETFKVEMKARLSEILGPNQQIKTRLVSSDYVELEFADEVQVRLGKAKFLNFLVRVTSNNLTSPGEGPRPKIQFEVMQTFRSQINQGQSLDMYVGNGTSRLNPEKAIAQASSLLGIGMLASITPIDPAYCIAKDCTYSIRIESDGVDSFSLSSYLKPAEAKIEHTGETTILEHLQGQDDMQTYIIKDMANATKAKNWRLMLIPIEGNPDIGVSIGSKPDSFEKNTWKTSQDRMEGIFITAEEFTSNPDYLGKPIYATFKSDKKSDFLFTISNPSNLSLPFLQPNVPITGEAHPGEIINYLFQGNVRIPEQIDAYLSLTAISGNPDLYFKDCADITDITQCRITQEDIDNRDELRRRLPNRLFVYSDETWGDDNHFVQFHCTPPSEQYRNFTPEFPDNKTPIFASKNCLFVLAVQGKATAASKSSKYSVEIKGAKYHNEIHYGKPVYMGLSPNKATYFKLVVPTAPEKHKMLTFRFVIVSGEADVLISRTVPYPSESSADKTGFVEPRPDGGASFVTFESTASQLEGLYYIAFIPRKFFYGSMTPYTSEINAEEFKGERYTELTFANPIVFAKKAKVGDQQSYYFYVDSPEGTDVEIVLELTPLNGKFDYCVSSTVVTLETRQDCSWYDDNGDGYIIITNKDKNFLRKGAYGVLVQPRIRESGEVDVEYKYSLSLSSQDSYYNLIQGIPYQVGTINAQKYFKILIDSETPSAALLLTTDDPSPRLLYSTRTDDLSTRFPSDMFGEVKGPNPGKWFVRSDIERICNERRNSDSACQIFMKVVPSKPQEYSYSILYYSINSPVQMLDGTVEQLPSPLSKDLRVKFYPSPSSSGTTISVFNEFYSLTVNAVFKAINDGNDLDGKVFSKTFVVKDPQVNVIRLPSSLFENRTSFEVDIQIINNDIRNNPSDNGDQEQDITRRTVVELSTSSRTLVPGVPLVEVNAQKGLFDYYVFKKKAQRRAFIYLSVLSGEADLYVRKGIDKHPDLNTYDYRSNTLKNDEIFIPASQFNLSETDNPEEVYTVGVFPRTAATYKIELSVGMHFHYMPVTPGILFSKIIFPSSPVFLVYQNQRRQAFTVGAVAQSSQLSVHYRAVDENQYTEFEKTLPNSSDAVMQISTPRFMNKMTITPPAGLPNHTQYIFKLEVNTTDYVSFYVSSPHTVLELTDGEMFADSLKKGTCQTYSFNTEREVTNQELHITVESGAIDFYVSPHDISATPLSDTNVGDSLQADSGPVMQAYKLAALTPSETEDGKLADNYLFKKTYLKVCSPSKSSNYELYMSIPDDTYQKLIPGERVNIGFSAAFLNQSYYYKVEPNTTKSLKLRFTIDSGVHDRPEDSILSLLKIYFVSDENFGFQGEEEARYVPANIAKQIKFDEYGFHYLLVTITPQSGILVIRPKEVSTVVSMLSMQLLVNDVQLISANGKTFSDIEPNQEYSFQIISPPASSLAVVLSACRGVFNISATDADKRPILPSTSIGRNLTHGSSDFFAELRRGAITRFNTSSRVVNIKVKGVQDGYTGLLTIHSETVRENDPLAVEDFFTYFIRAPSDNLPLVVEKHKDSFDLILDPIIPSEGFQERFPEYTQADIDIVVILGNVDYSRVTWESSCPLDKASFPSTAVVKRAGMLLNSVAGVLEWPNKRIRVDNIPYPSDMLPPYYVTIQIKITLLGPHSDSSDDDAAFLIKKHLTLNVGSPIEPVTIIRFFVILTLIVSGIICYVVYKNRVQGPTTASSRAAHQQVSSELPELHHPEQGTITRIETTEPHDDSENKPAAGVDLDQTI